MLYHYKATNLDGKVVEAEFEAEALGQVLRYLADHGLRPVSVKPLITREPGLHYFSSGISLTDKIFLTKYLSLMLSVGTDLLSAINVLISEFEKASLRNFLLEVQDNLGRGQQFYKAFERYPRVFPLTFVNLIKAAETSGTLEKTLAELSVSLSREADLRSRVRAALAYPLILFIMSFLVILFLTTFALPRIAKVFLETGVEPPSFSRFVFAVGLFMGDHAIVATIFAVLLLGGGAIFFLRTTLGRSMAGRLFSRLPYTRTIYREMAVQRFAATMSSLLKAGMPINQAITITADAVGAVEFHDALLRVESEGLAKGLTIGESFRREVVFPKVVTNLVAISESAGHLEEVLQTLAEFYAANVDNSIKTLVAFLEPALLLIMGALVGIIALSIILPVYQLTSQF